MTDTSYPVTTIAGHDYTLPPLQHSAPVLDHHRHAVPTLDGSQEDDGQISCICGYFDDDGWTVQCDHCKRWQHQICYYPDYEDRALPDDLQHYCVECQPRPYDHETARVRQRVKREDHVSEINGIKRQPPKNHKKKVKEPGYTNGWPLDKSRHDRNSASPRDQPPPAKRPKTSHRPSDSITKAHSRKRNTSNANHRRSLSRSPDTPTELYSETFMRCYQDDHWNVIDVNLFNSIGVSNALSEWLSASEESFRDMHGHEKTEALNRWDGHLDDIPGKAQIDIRVARDDRVTDREGSFPFWKWVTVQDSVANGAYIGELKGHVGFKEEYIQDPSNRWPLLRHPEPFVFFHSQLPIYIDARDEGSELRYVRRSCQPNARLQVLVTDSTVYRFCFMATQQIDPGMEVSVAWDTRDGVPELQPKLQSGLLEGDMDHICAWVSNALANCGPCACQSSESECKMARLDRRGNPPAKIEDEPHSVKVPKPRKRKTAHRISPLNTHLNSRSGSEARRVDLDDDPSDSRSPSGSAGRDSASRDNTPNTNGGLSAIPEVSERERKKLAKEEEMFRRQEEEQTGRHGKKKRNSGGSNLNTPNATSSKQLGFPGSSKYADASTSKQTGLPIAKSGKRPRSSTTQKSPATAAVKGMKRLKLEYVDSEVQCDIERDEDARRVPPSLPRKPFLSTTQRLLQRCALNNARRKGPAAVAEAERHMKEDDRMVVDDPVKEHTTAKIPSPTVEASGMTPEPTPAPDTINDAEMKDAVASEQVDISVQVNAGAQPGQFANPTTPTVSSAPTEPQVDTPAPPWPSQAAHSANEIPAASNNPHKPIDMHVPLPPPQANPFAAATSAMSVDMAGSIVGFGSGSFAQSPMSAPLSGPIFSPAVNAAVTPSPAKKKLSLSDYTKRNKAKDKEVETKGERESSPALPASGSVIPPLQASSSDLMKASENSSAVEDDVKMEDIGDTSTTA